MKKILLIIGGTIVAIVIVIVAVGLVYKYKYLVFGPSVTILYPKGGEQFCPDQKIEIQTKMWNDYLTRPMFYYTNAYLVPVDHTESRELYIGKGYPWIVGKDPWNRPYANFIPGKYSVVVNMEVGCYECGGAGEKTTIFRFFDHTPTDISEPFEILSSDDKRCRRVPSLP